MRRILICNLAALVSRMSHAIAFFRFPQLPRRLGAGIAVALAHIMMLVAVSTWAPGITRTIEAAPLQVALIAQQEKELETWHPPTPQMMAMPVTLAPPRVEVSIEPPPAPNAITIPASVAPPPSAGNAGTDAKVISEVAYLQPPAPKYPPESRRSREQGLVSLRVLIDERGHAQDVRIERSSGFPRLDEAARQAAARAIFKPYVESGIAQPAIVIIPIEFALNSRSRRG
jgi:periplasmic protein TonB